MEAPVLEILMIIVVLAGSVVLAWWTFRHASRLHRRIEELHPGFNERMRQEQRRK